MVAGVGLLLGTLVQVLRSHAAVPQEVVVLF